MSDAIPSVLVVSNDANFAESVQKSLTQTHSYQVRCESSPEIVLEVLKTEFFHIIILDDHADDISGMALAHEIRKTNPSKPDITLLSSDPKISLHECHQIGISKVLMKPLVMEDLREAINAAVNTGRRFQRIHISNTNIGGMRGEVHIPVEVNPLAIEVANLGRGGFFYELQNRLYLPKIGQEIDFHIRLTMVPNYSFEGKGVIRWIRNSGALGAGVEFLSIPEDSETLIASFVDLFGVVSYVTDRTY